MERKGGESSDPFMEELHYVWHDTTKQREIQKKELVKSILLSNQFVYNQNDLLDAMKDIEASLKQNAQRHYRYVLLQNPKNNDVHEVNAHVRLLERFYQWCKSTKMNDNHQYDQNLVWAVKEALRQEKRKLEEMFLRILGEKWLELHPDFEVIFNRDSLTIQWKPKSL